MMRVTTPSIRRGFLLSATAILLVIATVWLFSGPRFKPVDRRGIPEAQGYAECEYEALRAAAPGHSLRGDVATEETILACMRRRGY
jgi:hypothetical protein